MLLPPPETTITSVNQTPEALIAMLTLLAIGCLVYGLSKIKFTYFSWFNEVIVSANNFLARRQVASNQPTLKPSSDTSRH